jgi:hypothetical protein
VNKSVSQYNKAVKAPEKQWDDDLVRVEADCGSSRSRTWFETKQNVVRVEAHDVKAGMATPRRRQGPARAGLRPYGSGVMAARKRMRG